MIFFVSHAIASDCPQAKNSLQSLTRAAADILKQTQIDYVKRDPHDFCQRNMLLRGLNANHATPADVEKISTDELKEKYAERIQIGFDGVGAGWENSLIPTKSNRMTSFCRALGYGSYAICPDISQIRNAFSQPKIGYQISACPNAENLIPSLYGKNGCAVGTVPNKSSLSVKKAAACIEMTIWHSNSCKKGLDSIEQIMTPITINHGATFMPPHLWNKILGNRKYDEGLRLATVTILDRLSQKSVDKNANIFSDMQGAFKKSGMTDDEAIDASFDVLGLIGSASGNLGTRMHDLGFYSIQKTEALNTIAAALPLLDYKKSTEGKGSLYSLPSSVSSSCDNAKTYHFWLAAYISRTLVKDTKLDEVGAANATFVAEKGYQVVRSLARPDGVGIPSAIITKPPYDPIQQVQRMDLNFAAAGAEFGARSLKTIDTKLNLDQSLANMIENSNVTTPVSKEEVKGMGPISSYLKWEKEVSPNSALEAVQKQLDN